MRNLKFTIVAVILACLFVFAGCTKASKANLQNCNDLYDDMILKYTLDSQSNKTKYFDDEERVDLYSLNSFGTEIYNYINTINADGSQYYLNTLSKDGEYNVLVHAVSELFLKWKNTSFTQEIPQELIKNLYENIESLNGTLKELADRKDMIMTNFENYTDKNSIPMLRSLKEFNKYYLELIQKFFNVSVAYEKIYETVFPSKTLTSLRSGDITKLVLSSELYLAKYYYLKNIVLTNNYTSRFSFESVYNYETNEFVENEYYDSNFKQLVEMVNGDAVMGEPEAGNEDKIFYYNAGIQRLENLKNNIANLEYAVSQIKNNNDKNNLYKNFIDELQYEVQGYQAFILNNIMK